MGRDGADLAAATPGDFELQIDTDQLSPARAVDVILGEPAVTHIGY
jgi:hypothetical protein